MSDVRTATKLGAFLPCVHGDAVAYSAMMESSAPHLVRDVVAAAWRAGKIVPAVGGDHYATLDLLDDTGDIVGDYSIPTVEAWEWWVGIAGLRATASDCSACQPAAHAATYAA